MSELVLIHPPVAVPSEPPIGIATLAAELRAHGVGVTLIDAGVESLDRLLRTARPEDASSIAERRAIANLPRSLADLRSPTAYADADRYRRAVADLGKLLLLQGRRAEPCARVGLASYEEEGRSPLSSNDLRRAAAAASGSPFADCFAELAERVAAASPRAVGISINYLHQALPALALAGMLRQRLGPRVPLLAGGGLVRCWAGRLPADALQPALDRLVFDDGVAALLAVLGRGGPEHPTGGAIVAPDYDGMPWELYLAPRRIAPFVTTRGCVWRRCRYCPEALAVRDYRALPAAELAPALDALVARTGAGLLHLADSTIPHAALAALAERPLAVPWYGFTRFGAPLARPELARRLKRSGCAMLQLGLESGSPRLLARLRKGITLRQASAALHALAGEGIPVYLYVMFGIPGETRDDAHRTLDFVAAHAGCITCLNAALLNLPVGSPPEPDIAPSPLPGEDCDLTLYNAYRHTGGGWDRRAARHFMEREFAREPAIAAIIHRTPPVFGPNHAPFLELPAG